MLSREEILRIYQGGPEAMLDWVEQVVTGYESRVAELTVRMATLEARLNKDSHNSHQRPSSDRPARRPRPRSLRNAAASRAVANRGIEVIEIPKPHKEHLRE